MNGKAFLSHCIETICTFILVRPKSLPLMSISIREGGSSYKAHAIPHDLVLLVAARPRRRLCKRSNQHDLFHPFQGSAAKTEVDQFAVPRSQASKCRKTRESIVALPSPSSNHRHRRHPHPQLLRPPGSPCSPHPSSQRLLPGVYHFIAIALWIWAVPLFNISAHCRCCYPAEALDGRKVVHCE